MVAEHLIDNEAARRLLLELDGQEAWLGELNAAAIIFGGSGTADTRLTPYLV